MTTTYDEIGILNDLLKISAKDEVGTRLIGQWGTIANLVQNIEAAGLTPRQASVLKAAVGIKFIREEKPTVNSPADSVALVADLEFENQEHFVVLCFDRRNGLIERVNLYKGSVYSAQIRVGEVFRKPIILNASSIVIAHNHPTGDPTPSPDDVAVTRAIIQAGKLLDITVLDHVIIGSGNKWVSLKERGLGFN